MRTSPTPPLPGNSGHHAVMFYRDPHRLCQLVADFLGDGLAAQQPVVVIASPIHRKTISTELAHRHFDVERLMNDGQIVMLDAFTMLRPFMVNGEPHAANFRAIVGDVLTRAEALRRVGAVRAYGEMVDVLWRRGRRHAAIRLEILWNDLASRHALSLLCGYAMGNFYKETGRESICAQHTHVHA